MRSHASAQTKRKAPEDSDHDYGKLAKMGKKGSKKNKKSKQKADSEGMLCVPLFVVRWKRPISHSRVCSAPAKPSKLVEMSTDILTMASMDIEQ